MGYLDYIFFRFYIWHKTANEEFPFLGGIMAVYLHLMCLTLPLLINFSLIRSLSLFKWQFGIPIILLLSWSYYKRKDKILVRYRDSKLNVIPNYVLMIQLFVLMILATVVMLIIKDLLKKNGYVGIDDMIYQLCVNAL